MKQVNLRLDEGVLERVEVARGGRSREAWLREAVDRFLVVVESRVLGGVGAARAAKPVAVVPSAADVARADEVVRERGWLNGSMIEKWEAELVAAREAGDVRRVERAETKLEGLRR